MKGSDKKGITLWERYLTKEIGIEFKACLYFYCVLFFYSVYRISDGCFEASIIHMAQMIAAAYIMCYFQVFLLDNFDESQRLGVRELVSSIACSGIYTAVAAMCGWFDQDKTMLVIFCVFMEFSYICVFLIYKIKRGIDTKMLNEDLRAFKERRGKDE